MGREQRATKAKQAAAASGATTALVGKLNELKGIRKHAFDLAVQFLCELRDDPRATSLDVVVLLGTFQKQLQRIDETERRLVHLIAQSGSGQVH